MINWKKVGEHIPTNENKIYPGNPCSPYVPCIVWVANPNSIKGGIAMMSNWITGINVWAHAKFAGPYEITHFCDDINDPTAVMQRDFFALEAERLAWSLETFTEATPQSSLEKLKSEIKEIEEDLEKEIVNPMEYADALMCLLDSAGRASITPHHILRAFREKLEINKSRVWVKNPDNSYSHKK